MVRKLFIPAIFFLATICASSWEAGFFTSSFVNVPEGWYVMDNKEDKVTFADPADSAFFQIKRYPGNNFNTVMDIYSYVSRELGASGEGGPFLFDTKEGYFASISFVSS